jgi:hypothetical protein
LSGPSASICGQLPEAVAELFLMLKSIGHPIELVGFGEPICG